MSRTIELIAGLLLLVIGLLGCALIVAKHSENISRLLNGTENKIGQRIGGDARA